MCHSNAQCFAGEAIKCQVNINMALRNSFSYQCRIISWCVTQNLSGSQCNLRMKEAGRTHESLKSVKADMFTTLVLPPCSSPQQHSCARENPGGRSQQTCRACATSNQAFCRRHNRSQASSFSLRFRSTSVPFKYPEQTASLLSLLAKIKCS